VLGQEVFIAAVSTLLVSVAAAVARFGWNRRHVPTAWKRSVRRESYLGAVLQASEAEDVASLDVLAPRLTPAAEIRHLIGAIQQAWGRINAAPGGLVRVVTLDSEDCLKAGAELRARGIEVRVARLKLGAESLSYHIFYGPGRTCPTALVNHHRDGKDRPSRIEGTVPTQLHRAHFEEIWESASPFESVIAQRIIENAGHSQGRPAGRLPARTAVLSALEDVRDRLGLDAACIDRVVPHLAFRHGSQVIFVVGLPGSGKSFTRRRLAAWLKSMSISTGQVSDYPYAYRDFLHHLIRLEPNRGDGFEAHPGGAFRIRQESDMTPALHALAQSVLDRVNENEVTLVEFARADLVSALQEFEAIRTTSQVIYVSAPSALRAERIANRAEQPETLIDGASILLNLTDNHLLPSGVERDIYGVDDVDRLVASRDWRDRVTKIDNIGDDDGARIDAGLRAFIEKVTNDYRPQQPQAPDRIPPARSRAQSPTSAAS
jgi:dephospho-CoA kinase